MKLVLRSKLAAFGLACSAAGPALAAWNEAADGDLSGNGLAPTAVAMAVGANVVIGATGDSGTGIDRDYFSFSVPDGTALSAIRVLADTFVSGSSSFIGIQVGPQLTVSPTGAGAENLLGFAHYGSGDIGHDLLPAMVPSVAGSLPSGTYSVWVQETGGPVAYGFEFVLTAVPEPGGGALMLAGLLSLAALRRR